MSQNLNKEQLKQLIEVVFAPGKEDRRLCILIDVPNKKVRDVDKWKERRKLAKEWEIQLQELKRVLDLAEIELVYYETTGSNNADLPETAYTWQGVPEIVDIHRLHSEGEKYNLEGLLSKANIVLALTQFSATAPLKNLAKKYCFRAATMPGFSRGMIPALQVDYKKVHQQVMNIKTRLDLANTIRMNFRSGNHDYDLSVDVRHRTAHASSGLLREPGAAGNLPSGEAYIVPYEGELAEESKTNGRLPVQFEDEIVVYQIQNNRAKEIVSAGKFSEQERQRLIAEPAYGNIAEIGFGVLEPFGIKPIGVILNDEKLGLHIAFGRSEHFGGATSPQSFNNPENVIHIDRIYLPQVQNKIVVKEVVFESIDNRVETIMRDGEYTFCK